VPGNPWIGGLGYDPHPKQQQFLLHADTREVFYGGAGGGGKSQAIWFAALQYVTVPGYAALILRRTYADLALPQSLMHRSQEYLAGTAAEWNETKKRWTFPGGATITFGYVDAERDKFRYRSAEFQYIAFDELTDFSESQYTFLFTRLRRRAGVDVPLRMRSASNPGGPGHDWVKKRFVDARTRDRRRVFVPATMDDNPSLDREGYEESLENTDALTRDQIKRGNWDAVEGGRFKPEWFLHRYDQRGEYLVLRRPGEEAERVYRVWDCLRFGTCDPAASAKTSADYTVVGAWLVTPQNELVLLDADRFQAGIPDIPPRLEAFYRKWQLSYLGIEGVAANDGVYQLAARTRMAVTRLLPLGTDKLVRATQATNYAQAGRIWFPPPGLRPGMPLDDVESELYRFTGDDKRDDHDDAVDMVSYAARLLSDGACDTSGSASVPHILGGRTT